MLCEDRAANILGTWCQRIACWSPKPKGLVQIQQFLFKIDNTVKKGENMKELKDNIKFWWKYEVKVGILRFWLQLLRTFGLI